MKNFALVFTFVLISFGIVSVHSLSQKEQPTPSTLVITGVTIVDVEKSILRKNCTVDVSGEKIQKISNQSNTDVPSGIRIIDGHGLFLIPGLMDAHVHYYDQAVFGPMMIVNGVLFVRDMGNQTHDSRSSDRYGGVASDVAIRARQLGFYEKDTQSSFCSRL